MQTFFFWIVWGIISLWAIKTFYYFFSKEIKKTAVGNPIKYIEQIKQRFKRKSLLQKVLILTAGMSLLFTMYIVSVLVRYNDSSGISVGNIASIQGKVMDQNGKPIDGATIAVQKRIAVAKPDGTFTIQATISDTLTVSAFGYESTHISASEPSATLSALALGTVRVEVVGPDNTELKDTLVYRLDANTFIPIEMVLADVSGSALFQDIPSGQAAFVVIHPEYGTGWVQTALEPGTYNRSVVRLEDYKAERKTLGVGFHLVKTAYAQNPTSPEIEVRNSLSIQMTKDTKVNENTYYLSEESKTVIAVGTNKEKLTKFVDFVKKSYPDTHRFVMGDQTMLAIDRIKEKEGITSPLTTVRITQGPSETHYQIHYGWQQREEEIIHIAEKIDQRTFTVEIERPTIADTMVFLRAQHAALQENGQPVTVTSWSKAEAAELAGVEKVIFDQPMATVVCCTDSDGSSGSKNSIVVSEASSQEVLPSNLTLSKPDNTAEYLNYSHNTINEMMGGQNLVTTANKILEQNPNLKFVDETGNEFSFLDITAPNPNDAPPAFLLDFFENRSDARSKYLDDLTSYQRKWKQFMAAVGSEAFQKQGVTPSEFKRSLLKDYGTRSAWRLEEEKRLTQQSGKQSTDQQNTNQQSAPVNTQDEDGQTEQPDSLDDTTQVTIIESPDEDSESEQVEQQQENNSNSQGSGTGTNNSNPNGQYYGPQGVQSR